MANVEYTALITNENLAEYIDADFESPHEIEIKEVEVVNDAIKVHFELVRN